MRINRVRFSFAIVTAIFTIIWLASCTPQQLTTAVLPEPTFSPDIPLDVPKDGVAQDFYYFAWNEFIAVNWAALPGQNGVPDPSVPPTGMAETVWETWRQSTDVFQANPSTDWNADPLIPSICPDGAAGMKVLQQTTKVNVDLLNLGDNFTTGEATGYILHDSLNNLVHFEVRMNRDEFEYIISPQPPIVVNGTPVPNLYEKTNAMTATNNKATNPNNASFINLPSGPTGAMEIKAAWRILDGLSQDVVDRYYHVEGLIYNPNAGTCDQHVLGLVGLHLIHKTSNWPNWVWASFEQVDNTNPPANSPLSTPAFLPPIATPNPTPPSYRVPGGGAERPASVAIAQPVQDVNQVWQAELAEIDSVWQYYQLLGVEWNIENTSSLLGNITMETDNIAISTCIGCHNRGAGGFGGGGGFAGANTSGYDFSWMLALEPYATPAP